jgi:hypothetical protein
MGNIYRDLLFFILFGLAEAFLIWALWNFYKAGGKW